MYKYQLINELKHKYTVVFICDVIKISPKSYYKYLKKINTPQKKPDLTGLSDRIVETFTLHKGRYGYRKIHAELSKEFDSLKEHQVYKIYSDLGMECISRRKKKKKSRYSNINAAGYIYENKLERDFTATEQNQKWVTDSTMIKLVGKELHLSAVLDIYNNMVKGYGCSLTLNSELINETFEGAFLRLKNNRKPLIIHTDQGVIYRSNFWRELLAKQYKIEPSMSRKGNPWDNACIENFFSNLKQDLPELKDLKTIEEAKEMIKEYIDYYNNQRIQTVLGNESPSNFNGVKVPFKKRAKG
ncbi:IS3 family transposase [Bacillus sp. BGMRC 2118]|nr:IS3 family transposase [Bacillus sp. BGMRC 2118]